MAYLSEKTVLFVLGAAIGIASPTTETTAHPHMFFDAHAQYLIDDAGLLEGVRVAFVVDEFNSLYIVADLGVDADNDGALSAQDQAIVAEGMRNGLVEYGFFTDLRIGDARQEFDAAENVAALLQEGRIAVRFDLLLDQPTALVDAPATLSLYDPTYFTAVLMTGSPDIVGDGDKRCAVAFDPFKENSDLADLQSVLLTLGREETPTIENVGALFADNSELQCLG